MRKSLLLFALFFFAVTLFAQNNFEGTLTVTYTSGKEQPVIADVKIKGHQVYIKQKQNGNAKYDFFVLDLQTKIFYTVSAPDKKVIISYDYDKLAKYYEAHNLKEGYKTDYKLAFKQTDKTKEENGMVLTKSVAEDDLLKATVWTTTLKVPFNELIPVLRLLNNWNEAQAGEQAILEAEVTNKASKRESTVNVVVRKETISKDVFKLPKDYLSKDFSLLMEQEKDNGKLPAIVQSFASF
jgi:hypothetical protein